MDFACPILSDLSELKIIVNEPALGIWSPGNMPILGKANVRASILKYP